MTYEIINISNLKVLLTPLRPLSLKLKKLYTHLHSKWRFSFFPVIYVMLQWKMFALQITAQASDCPHSDLTTLGFV